MLFKSQLCMLHHSMLPDSHYISWGEDLIMYMTVKTLCCMLEINIILDMNYTSIKKYPPKKSAIYMYMRIDKELKVFGTTTLSDPVSKNVILNNFGGCLL